MNSLIALVHELLGNRILDRNRIEMQFDDVIADWGKCLNFVKFKCYGLI